MKLLITGSTGMVGRNILENSYISSCQLLTPNSKCLNLLNFSEVDDYLRLNKPDFIIHSAGKVGGILSNMKYPVEFMVENIDMARNIILAAKQNNIKNLLNFGSSSMYPKNAINPLNEDFILKGELESTNEGYALAKIIATRLCEFITNENNGFLYKTIIPCNLYGKYDRFDEKSSHMIPGVIGKIYNAKIKDLDTVEIWGDGNARREFMYAGDLANYIEFAIKNFIEMPQNINVGLGYDYSINEYYKTISDIIGFKGVFNHNLSKPVGMKQKVIDTTRLNEYGWKPKTSLLDGIQKTYQYYKNL
jgi:GDP-L-fucose synthase